MKTVELDTVWEPSHTALHAKDFSEVRGGGPNTQRSEDGGVWREEDEMDGQAWAGLRMRSEQGRFRPSVRGATWQQGRRPLVWPSSVVVTGHMLAVKPWE